MNKTWYTWAGGVLALLLMAAALWWHWQPERQLRLHLESLLGAYSERDWEALQKLVAEEYADRWNYDKATLVQDSREAFRHFIFVEAKATEVQCTVQGRQGFCTARILVTGRGSPVADLIMDRVRSLESHFRFQWVQKSGKPWDWQLVAVEQPELSVERVGGVF